MCVCVCSLQEATQGGGIDVIVEMLSNVNLSADLQMLALGGRVMVSITKSKFLRKEKSSSLDTSPWCYL